MPPSSRMLTLKECYDILGIDKSADLQELKRAYRRKAFELHPDLNPNNPDSSRQFQLLNEAYVALSAILKSTEKTESRPGPDSPQPEHATAGPESSTDSKERDFSASQRREAHKAYAQQDVLRDLLNDPFARRVFEDIYSELNRQQASEDSRTASQKQDQSARAAKENSKTENDKKTASAQKSATRIINPPDNDDAGPVSGVGEAVKGWLRKQIDDEQSIVLPAAGLRPGRRVRLQIRRGFSDEIETVEVTLPANFAIGKPLRLKGLGKKVGPWVGDLYLTLNSRE